MSTHTPGPWIVEDGCIEAPQADGRSKMIGSVLIGCTKGIHRVGSKTEQTANARLIACAPKLLEVLQMIGDTIASDHPNDWTELGVERIESEIREVLAAVSGRRAPAKLEGCLTP